MTFTTTVSPSFLATDGLNVDSFFVPSELTLAQAAEFLRMPEQRLDDLLNAGEISFKQEKGGERMVLWASILDFELERERMHTVVDEMIRREIEMGFYDDL